MHRTLTLATVALMGSTALAHAAGTLNLFNWGNYTSPEMIAAFTAATGITVTITDFDSNDTALARVRQGGHGFDIVVPSDNFVPIWIEEGLVQRLDPAIVTDRANIMPEFLNAPFDPGREFSVPWQWGITGISVNTATYSGNIHSASLIFNPPPELVGRINVIPEMSSIMALAIYYHGGEDACTTDMDLLRQVRDTLTAARPKWLAMDYGTVDNFAAGDFHAGVNWNGASMRSRLLNPDVAFGFPETGFPIWMDNAMVLADAPNRDNAMKFLNFILQPENAAKLSNFARYSHAIIGADAFLDEVMADAPELNPPAELYAMGRWSPVCSQEVTSIHAQIWTELMQ